MVPLWALGYVCLFQLTCVCWFFLFPCEFSLLYFPLSALLIATCSLFFKPPCDQVTSQMCSETSRTTCLSGWGSSPPMIKSQPTFSSYVLFPFTYSTTEMNWLPSCFSSQYHLLRTEESESEVAQSCPTLRPGEL